ncbi:hypothetical protein KP509_31G046400 [Ceratopteris richardii]|uniref:Uncharacterized protein n=1 Tax=Ceratopteris richardii TaxID=49495 RepID=A0A8T2QZT5_CERRI|nr:hypothetical protein KP509_31G046400 [Ceratopteris richardii]KAH7288843.1 hypothetical protein KP509_31G046400 [Ceratopteris richardii]KAH7288844.1 hypothetical protein KP509_31G046400 [Ceratopteris richardii]KAH7288845.1 hypothetical protein KP509_31G046400 [Ceratopteris richardii]KAH7288846.1 hypothetical protein KP509_31G046400 [Ceratopteris richardii]
MAQSTMSMKVTKAPFEEKFVHLYKEIFSGRSPIHAKKDSGLHGHAAVTRFWDELLLLKVNESFLTQCIANLSEAQLNSGMKLVLNELFGTCSLYLDDENFIRVAHSLETLIILFQEIFKKRFTEQGFTIITLIAGSVENADLFFMRLIGRVANLLQRDDVPIPVKSLCLRLYITILTTTDNVNTNVIASYLFQNNIFNAILAAMSVKLAGDRRILELDAALVLILLLLWREGPNVYSEILSVASSPVVPLFLTAHSLMKSIETVIPQATSDSSLQFWSLTSSVYNMLGSVFGINMAVSDKHKGNAIAATPGDEDEFWLCSTSGIVLYYFLVYNFPLVKSTQLWPSINESLREVPGSFPQSASSSWLQLLKTFISLCSMIFPQLSTAEAKEILQAKCCLNILRCILESREALEFLALSNSEDYSFKDMSKGISGIPQIIPSSSVLCVILDNALSILHVEPNSFMDPDLFNRAVMLVPIIFNSLKLRGWQLSEHRTRWLRLWNGLMKICVWAENKNNSHRPGAIDLIEIVLGVLESCLGGSQDLFSVPEVSEQLHAVMMCHMGTLESLMERATSPTFNPAINLSNLNAVKSQYEIQIAAMGIRGNPTYEQALQAVQKKGMLSLKLKAKHAGPTHAYVEGTVELRCLINTARSLVALHRKRTSMRPPRLEEAFVSPNVSA